MCVLAGAGVVEHFNSFSMNDFLCLVGFFPHVVDGTELELDERRETISPKAFHCFTTPRQVRLGASNAHLKITPDFNELNPRIFSEPWGWQQRSVLAIKGKTTRF